MTKRAFVDSSVIVEHLIHSGHSSTNRSSELIANVANGVIDLFISETVVLESVHVLSKVYGVPKETVCARLIQLLSIPGIIHPNKSTMLKAFRYWASQGPLSFADCYHLALTADLGLSEIYAFDKKMGRYPGVTRIEP